MTTTKDAVVDEVASLAAQGQGIESLTYPIGVKKPGAPGIVTVVLLKKDDPRGQPQRYFAEQRMGSLPRTLALLDMVAADAAVEGIESQIVMIDMMPDTERTTEIATATARLAELEQVTKLLSKAGQALYTPRIEVEAEALTRLLEAAGQPYVPEVQRTEEESMAEAEAAVDKLLNTAANMHLTEPTEDAVAKVVAEIPVVKGR